MPGTEQVPVEVEPEQPLRSVRIGLAAGVVGILCCVGPVVLALFGILAAAEASDLAYDLYGKYAWWFRAAGLLAGAALIYYSLKRRGRCDIQGVNAARKSLLIIAAVAVVTYVAIYAFTTWLGDTFA